MKPRTTKNSYLAAIRLRRTDNSPDCHYAGPIDTPQGYQKFAIGERADGDTAAWLSFTGCLIAVFMQMVDGTIVTTALPSITADLSASPRAQLLVVSGYALAFACTLLTAARLGELLGRRRLFLAATAAFTAASVWCGISGSAAELVAARVVQGIAAAGMAAQTIAIATASFPRARLPQVFAVYGAVAGFAGMLGPILGGALVTADPFGLGWHAIFLINLPLGLVTFALALRYLRLGRPPQRERLDPGGAALSTASLFALLWALTDIQQHGWRPAPLALIAVAVGGVAAFLVQQRRAAARGNPLVRFDLFADRGFRLGSGLVTVFFGLFTAFVFAVSITLQEVLRFTPWRTGVLMTPFAVGACAGALASPMLVRRWGVRVLAAGIIGFGVCVAVGAVYLWLTAGAVSVPLVIGPVLLAGLGVGVFCVPLQPVMLSRLAQRQLDSASGLLPTIEQIGNALGLALLSAVFFRAHTLSGSVSMFTAIAVVAVATGVATLALPEPPDRR
ncbi:MFS transporter [Nocardia sp. CC201C]|uniref:MFS transporter n=1 Tax=Nocardia sp. CC201C TaxID=3044575 RepID=UPI0024A7E933|nr:MFS transporter [Nocardia sp. CC201C]